MLTFPAPRFRLTAASLIEIVREAVVHRPMEAFLRVKVAAERSLVQVVLRNVGRVLDHAHDRALGRVHHLALGLAGAVTMG